MQYYDNAPQGYYDYAGQMQPPQAVMMAAPMANVPAAMPMGGDMGGVASGTTVVSSTERQYFEVRFLCGLYWKGYDRSSASLNVELSVTSLFCDRLPAVQYIDCLCNEPPAGSLPRMLRDERPEPIALMIPSNTSHADIYSPPYSLLPHASARTASKARSERTD